MVSLHRIYMYDGDGTHSNALAWSPDGTWLVSCRNKTVYGNHRERVSVIAEAQVWDARSGKIISTYHHHTGAILALAWSPDGRHIASAGWDHTVQLWNAADGTHLSTYREQTNAVCSLAWSPDGTCVVSAASTIHPEDTPTLPVLHIWRVADGATIGSYKGHQGSLFSVAWSPHQECIASTGQDPTVHLWESTTGKLLYTYREHTASVYQVAWSPDGWRIATSSQDQTAHIWNALTGKCLHRFISPHHAMMGVAWSPHSHYLATISNVGQIWDTATGHLISTFGAPNTGMDHISWSPSGEHIAFTQGTRIQVWQVQYD